MRITHEQLVAVIDDMFEAIKPTIANNGTVIVATTFEGHKVDVYISLGDKYESCHNKPEQMLEIMFAFVDQKGRPLNFADKSHAEREILCGALNSVTRWSKAATSELRKGLVTIGLWRSINTSQEDLERAAADDPECELCTAFESLEAEYGMAADIVAGFLKGEVEADEHLVQLIEGQEAVMH